MFEDGRRCSLSPEGEGRGEGERSTGINWAIRIGGRELHAFPFTLFAPLLRRTALLEPKRSIAAHDQGDSDARLSRCRTASCKIGSLAARPTYIWLRKSCRSARVGSRRRWKSRSPF